MLRAFEPMAGQTGVCPTFGSCSRLASAPGVRAVALAALAQTMRLVHPAIGATTVAAARDSVACANRLQLQRPGAATRHTRLDHFMAPH